MKNKIEKVSKPDLILFLLVTGTIANLLTIFFVPEGDLKIILSDILFILLNSFSVLALFFAAFHTKKISMKLSRAWFTIAMAQIAFVIGDIVWFVFEAIYQIEPFPSIADFFYLIYYPILLFGIFFFPREKTSRFDTTKKWLESLIVLLSAILFFWVFLIEPLTSDVQKESFLVQFLTLAYPVGDIVLFSALLILIYNYPKGKTQAAIIFIIGSILIQIVTDIVFSYQSLTDSYISAGGWDCGWVFGYLLLGIAGVVQTKADQVSRKNSLWGVFQEFPIAQHIEKISANLPYFFVFFSYTLLVFFITEKNPANYLFMILINGAIIFLVLARQHIVIVENWKLNKELRSAFDELKNNSLRLQQTNVELRHEIVERKRIENQLAFDALHDSLTQLPNRTLLLDRLNHALEISKRNRNCNFSVLFVDLDQFKNVNDTLGHNVGDELLINFSDRIGTCIRKSDTFARLGGDEFAILLENHLGHNQAVEIADRIQNALQDPYKMDGQNFFITASIGIVDDINDDYDSAEAILRDADIAMYRAKELGRARYEVFSTPLRAEMLSRIKLESQMRTALKNSEFILHYQPIYELVHKRLIGFEALLRWNHPQLGLLMPADFLSIAENSGLIIDIGDWVLFEACRQMKEWRDRYPNFLDLSINVNLSGKQFMHHDLMDKIVHVLQETELPPKALHLEITETVMIENQDIAATLFNKLHKLGVELQIDDFGSGYSSIGYLQRFPVDTIKIDGSFIRELEKNYKGAQIVNTMVKMACDLGMDIIAEGIETHSQLDRLIDMACDYGQGFYLSYPLPVQKVEKMLEGL